MIAICWDHWCPPGWPRIFPFEIFLFFFLVLTGYLITGSLLRERDRNDSKPGKWRLAALKTYQVRRGLRILAPYYAALALTWIIMLIDIRGISQPPDVQQAPWWYVFHLSNIHMAFLGQWPVGTNHFWSLSIQQQFYLLWPFVIWFLPRKWLVPALLVFSATGPATRMAHDFFSQWFAWPQVMTWTAFDYFGIGGLLALAVHGGMKLESRGLRMLSWAGLACYVVIFSADRLSWPTFGLRPFQQTFLSVGLCGVIAAGSVGFGGGIGRFLNHPVLQRIGQLSYGVYLFHNLAPLIAGKLFWFLWDGDTDTIPLALLKTAIYATLTWGLALASWRWIEQPLQEVRARIRPEKSQPPAD